MNLKKMEKIILYLLNLEVIVLFFLYVFLLIIAFNIMMLLSTIKIEIKDLDFILPKKEKNQNEKNYKIFIKFYFLKFFRIFKISITDEKIRKKKINELIQSLDIIKDKNIFEIKIIDGLKRLNIKLEKLDLKVYLGTEDAAITAILIGIISSGLGIILRNKTENLNNAKFETIPIYQDKNYLKIYLNSIFKTNMIHIIYIIYILIKKGRVEENVRTSNRRAYAYSDE